MKVLKRRKASSERLACNLKYFFAVNKKNVLMIITLESRVLIETKELEGFRPALQETEHKT